MGLRQKNGGAIRDYPCMVVVGWIASNRKKPSATGTWGSSTQVGQTRQGTPKSVSSLASSMEAGESPTRPGSAKTSSTADVEISLVSRFGDRAECASLGTLEREILDAAASGR